MTGPSPILSERPFTASASSTSNSGSTTTPSNQLTANSFITLLTTQLQAQDPLNPLDPNQMVNELTTMNSFEQLLQIRQDLDALLSAAQNGTGNPGAGSGTQTGSSAAIATPSKNNATASQIPALSSQLVSNSLATLSSQLNSKSQLF